MVAVPPSPHSHSLRVIRATSSVSTASRRVRRKKREICHNEHYTKLRYGVYFYVKLGSMMQKSSEKAKAIALRREGKTYGEILSLVPVSKSTLSLWLRDVNLARPQQQIITKKRAAAQRRGGAARRTLREVSTEQVIIAAQEEIGHITKRELFLIGIALYWAEGSKQKDKYPSARVCFSNSDPYMVKVFMRWLRTFSGIQDDDIELILHIHEVQKSQVPELQKHWLGITGLQKKNLSAPVFKKHEPKTLRKNASQTYRGLVAIRVRRSTILNRRIKGLVKGIIASVK